MTNTKRLCPGCGINLEGCHHSRLRCLSCSPLKKGETGRPVFPKVHVPARDFTHKRRPGRIAGVPAKTPEERAESQRERVRRWARRNPGKRNTYIARWKRDALAYVTGSAS